MSTALYFYGEWDGSISGGQDLTTGVLTASVVLDSAGMISGNWAWTGTWDATNDPYLKQGQTLAGQVSLSGGFAPTPGAPVSDTQWFYDFTGNAPFVDGGGVIGTYLAPATLGGAIFFELPLVYSGGSTFPVEFSIGGSWGGLLHATNLPPIVSIDHYSGQISESTPHVSVTLSRSGADLNTTSTVLLSTEDGAAVSSGQAPDFAADTQLITFNPGVASITVDLGTIYDDTTPEFNENLHIRLSDPVNASLGPSTGDVVILDNDGGTSGPDALNGAGGPDTIAGLDGNDTLNGGAGHDSVLGGLGNDLALGGPDDDIVRGGAGSDTLRGGLGNDLLVGGTENDQLFGGENRDTLDGGDGNDWLDGGSGLDSLFGGTGDDTLDGGAGNDVLRGSLGNDSIVGGDSFDQLFAGQGNDTLRGGFQGDTLNGGEGNDYVTGGGGLDLVGGGQGNDTVIGGDGMDTLAGGQGADTFLWNATTLGTGDLTAGGIDRVTVVVADHDVFKLPGVIDELDIGGTLLNALTADTALGTVIDANNAIAYVGGVIRIDVDGNNTFNATNDFQIDLTGSVVTTVTYDHLNDQLTFG